MKPTTTRARTGRGTAEPRRTGRTQATYVDGANALALDYVDYTDDLDYVDGQPGGPPAVQSAEPVPTYQPRRRGPRVAPEARPVAPPLPISLPRAPFLILMVSLVVIGVVGVLVLNTRINENAFRLDSLQNQQSSLDLQEQQLNQNLADLEAPGNLRAAAARLGLVPAGTVAFISLPNGKVVGVPQPAYAPTSAASTADAGR
jgi:hypothetical protein